MKSILLILSLLYVNTSSFGQCAAMGGITLPSSGTCTAGCSGTAPFDGQNINSVGTYYCYTSGSSGTFASLTVTNGYLRVCGNLTITSLTFATSTMGGIIIESGGTLTVTNNVTIPGNNSIRVYGTLNLNGDTYIGSWASGMQIESTGKVTSAIGKTYKLASGNVLINKGQFFVRGTLEMASGSSMCTEESYTEVATLFPTSWQPVTWGGASGKKAVFNVTSTMNNTSTSFTASSSVSLCNKGCTVGCGTVPNSNTWDDGGSATLSTSSCTNSLALPVLLSNFYAISNQNEVTVHWSTTFEMNNDHFDLERSHDGINFEKITEVKGQDTKNTPSTYVYADTDVNTLLPVYYRLKQVDVDGQFNYSNLIVLNGAEGSTSIDIYPNPLEEGATLYARFGQEDEGKASVSLFDLSGKLIHEYLMDNIQPGGLYAVEDKSLLLFEGTYLMQIKTAQHVYNQKLEVK
jgi:hypothetical protein